MKVNAQKGIDYQEQPELNRAKEADLITLPKKVEGTNCANCQFVKILNADLGLGYCVHPQVQLPVTKTMCCKFWDAEGATRSWKK